MDQPMNQPMNDATRKLQLEMLNDQMIKDFPLFQKMHVEAGRSAFSYYTALIDAGFNETQALEIIKAHGIGPKTP